jgi:uncharacterized repeat protein (TIGR02543 family)
MVLLGNGDGTLQGAVHYATGLGGPLAAGDVDNDGQPELIIADGTQDSTPTDTFGVVVLNPSELTEVTFVTSPPGLQIDYGFFVTPQEFSDAGCAVTPCTGPFKVGTQLQLNPFGGFDSAYPGVNFVFAGYGPGVNAQGEATVPRKPVTYTFYYTPFYPLVVQSSPSQGGSVTVPTPSLSPNFFATGTTVTITASPNPGFTFTGWTGPVANPNSPTTTVTMTTSITITANFVAMVSVPNVVGQTQAAASSAITTAGLVVGNISSAASNTVATGSVISQSPVGGTQVNSGSPVNLVISTGSGAPPPSVTSVTVLFGTQSFTLGSSPRVHLPWQITGIRVAFSAPIASGNAASLTGATATQLQGLGTNTLTWTINPISLGNVAMVLAGSGGNSLLDGNGIALNGGSGFSQSFKVLWGDFNDDGAVSATDLLAVNQQVSKPYNIFADMNGDGVVNSADVQVVRSRAGTSLP